MAESEGHGRKHRMDNEDGDESGDEEGLGVKRVRGDDNSSHSAPHHHAAATAPATAPAGRAPEETAAAHAAPTAPPSAAAAAAAAALPPHSRPHTHPPPSSTTHADGPALRDDPGLVVPFAERLVVRAAALAEAALGSTDLSDGLRAKLREIRDVPAALARALSAALSARLFGDGLLGRPAPPPLDPALEAAVNELRQRVAQQHAAQVAALVASLPQLPHCDDGPQDATAITRLATKLQVLSFAAHHIEAGTGSALAATKDELDALPVAEVYSELADLYADRVLSYPWKRFSCRLSPDAMMYNLRMYKTRPVREEEQRDPVRWREQVKQRVPHNINFSARYERGELFPLRYDGGFLSVVHDEADYDAMDVLVDIFQEEQRLAGRRQDQTLSPLQLWAKRDFVASTLATVARKHGRIDSHLLREHLYEAVKECTQFKPTLVVAVLRHFRARRVLDFSAGWGDRLAGAIAADVDKYVAYDPNVALKAGHDELIRRYVPADRRSRFQITYTGFEQAHLRDDDFDLVFTSPPFFDFEIYTQLPGQSVDTYRSLTAWLVHFLLGCLRRAWRALRVGGHVVIHITDVFKTRVCEPMCLLMQSQLPHARYVGVMTSVGKVGRPRPMWVFCKAEQPASAERIAASLRELQRLYPDVHATLQDSLLQQAQQQQQQQQEQHE